MILAKGFVEFSADLVGFEAEEDPVEDGPSKLLMHCRRRVQVGGMGILQKVKCASNPLLDVCAFRPPGIPSRGPGSLVPPSSAVAEPEEVTGDGVGVVGVQQRFLVRLRGLAIGRAFRYGQDEPERWQTKYS